VRADNMGDVLMTTPALRALKQTFGADISLLTSHQGKPVCSCIPEIDDIIVANLPWVKLNDQYDATEYDNLIKKIRSKKFDAAIIFTVYSQSSLPGAMLCYQAEIPLRLAYVRENPYALLTDWVPDKEPYTYIKHQVARDLDLVKVVGAFTKDTGLSICLSNKAETTMDQKLSFAGIYLPGPFLIFHAGVSEVKREYPSELWNKLIRNISKDTGKTIVLTGSSAEKGKVNELMHNVIPEVYNVAGMLTIEELAVLIKRAECVVSVNTAIVHIAAAVKTPVVVLYANTNPQHTPWQVPNRVLTFSVEATRKSNNEVIRYVDQKLYSAFRPYPTTEDISRAIFELINNKTDAVQDAQLLLSSQGK
jgi:lipopolysaccharide heptosyltransferase II